jgi:hypothetical protein
MIVMAPRSLVVRLGTKVGVVTCVTILLCVGCHKVFENASWKKFCVGLAAAYEGIVPLGGAAYKANAPAERAKAAVKVAAFPPLTGA